MKKKYYVFYDGAGSFTFFTQEEYAAESELPGGEAYTNLADMSEYGTIAEVKRYLRMHLKGDINDCKLALEDVAKLRAQ